MTKEQIKQEVREKLANLCHEQWSGWMEYLFSKAPINKDGTWTMPKWAVDRWTHQCITNYDNLSEEEKESNRNEADKFINIFLDIIATKESAIDEVIKEIEKLVDIRTTYILQEQAFYYQGTKDAIQIIKDKLKEK